MKQSDIGIVGLGVMGKALAANLLDRGFRVSGYNQSPAASEELAAAHPGGFRAAGSYAELAAGLKEPRVILMMVPAGSPVDDVLAGLAGCLARGDVVIDGGNSYFRDTERRQAALAESEISLFGAGISGGEEGARRGPSIMPGGRREDYAKIGPILEAIAAKKDGQPCCGYIGPGGSGHYVKMVHNGIEYADMQLLAEAYLILKNSGCGNAAIADILDQWDKTEAESYLVRISAAVLREPDELAGGDLIDVIRDQAGNKGTGKWTSEEALRQEYNASLLTAAYGARIMSNQTELRRSFGSLLPESKEAIDPERLRRAYYLAKAIAYAQGFGLYADASEKYQWGLDLGGIAGIFRAGCIIQAKILQEIREAFADRPDLRSILTAPRFRRAAGDYAADLREIVLYGVRNGIPVPLFANAWTYLSQLAAPQLGASLIQGQRDYFGAHTLERTDAAGAVHHRWKV